MAGVLVAYSTVLTRFVRTGVQLTNSRGTVSVAHHDVPDCGNTEIFINLENNAHLDEVFGGYCVFAEVADEASFRTVDAIAAAVKGGEKTKIIKVCVTS